MTLLRLVLLTIVLLVPAWPSQASNFLCGLATIPCQDSPVEGLTLKNSQTTGAANTAVTVTLAAVQGVRSHIFAVDARCSAGTSNLSITDGGTTIWSTGATDVGATTFIRTWPVGLTGSTNSAVVITLATCGVGNTGTLIIEADQY